MRGRRDAGARRRPAPRRWGPVLLVAAWCGLGGVVGTTGAGVSWPGTGAAAVHGEGGASVEAGAWQEAAAADGGRTPRRVYVVRLAPAGFEPDPAMTPEAVRRAVEGASAYWSEQTGGEVSFAVVSVSPWIRSRQGCSDIPKLWEEARAQVGSMQGRAHLVVVAPAAAGVEGSGCDFGYGSLGRADVGGAAYVTALHPALLAHELGHNLTLGHAGALECPSAQDGAWDGTSWTNGCEVVEYDDLFDVMGYSGPGFGGGYLGAVGLDRIGAAPGEIRRVTGAVGDVRLSPMSHVGSGVRVLAVEAPGEPVYYAELRTGAGRDAEVVSGRWRPTTGVRILRRDPTRAGDGSLELDATPGGRRYDRALRAGETFTSASGGVRITVTSLDANGATLSVDVRPGTAGRS